jgi:hypothetical protein
LSPEINHNSIGSTDLTLSEDNISIGKLASVWIPIRGLRARHGVQCADSNSGDPRNSPKRSLAYDAANGGSQMAARESDTGIVPMISGNADVGKAVYTNRPCPRDTSTIHRDR